MANDRYKNGKIYKLVNDCDDKIYVGSTCLPLSKRLYNHKKKAKLYPDRNVYKHISSIGWENVQIILIESYSCDNNMELLKRERYYIDELKPELNIVIPGRTQKEYYDNNISKIKEYLKKYRDDNRDNLLQKKKEYYENNKDKIKESQKIYVEKNKEMIQQNKKKYRENNKDEIKDKKSQLWHCDICNCNITIGVKARHMKSLKHQNNMN